MIYPRFRVILTTCNVGLFGLLAILGLTSGFAREFFRQSSSPCLGEDALQLLLAVGVYAVASAPFDWIGGYLAPRKFKRSKESAGAYAARWLRGVFWHALLLFAAALLAVALFRVTGSFLAIAGLALVLMLVVTASQRFLAFLLGKNRAAANMDEGELGPVSEKLAAWNAPMPQPMVLAEAEDRTFVGGWTGLGAGRVLLFPRAWVRDLKPEVAASQLVRRKVTLDSGLRIRGVLAAVLWNLLGLFLVWLLIPGIDPGSVAGIVELSLGFTLWSIFGVLVSPVFNRAAVYHADRLARDAGVPEDVLIRAFSALNRQQEDELAHSGSRLEAWFNPYPSLDTRIRTLTEGYRGLPLGLGAWQLAPMLMVLSWPCLGLISRAVQSNIGKPDLWVLLPGD